MPDNQLFYTVTEANAHEFQSDSIVDRLKKLIEDLRKKAEEAVELEKLKNARAALAEENKREMCDEAIRTLVTVRLQARVGHT